MRIAVACKGLSVSPRFEIAECLTCYNVNKGIMVGCQTLPFPKVPVKDLLLFFSELGVRVLICGAIEPAVEGALASQGVEVLSSSSGTASAAASAYVAQALCGEDEVDSDEDEDIDWDTLLV